VALRVPGPLPPRPARTRTGRPSDRPVARRARPPRQAVFRSRHANVSKRPPLHAMAVFFSFVVNERSRCGPGSGTLSCAVAMRLPGTLPARVLRREPQRPDAMAWPVSAPAAVRPARLRPRDAGAGTAANQWSERGGIPYDA
jgi:hypothetical protein